MGDHADHADRRVVRVVRTVRVSVRHLANTPAKTTRTAKRVCEPLNESGFVFLVPISCRRHGQDEVGGI